MKRASYQRMLGAAADPVALQKVINHFGGDTALGKKLGVSRFAVYTWKVGLRNMPAEMAFRMEKLTDGLVLREELLPEIFDRSWSKQKLQNNQPNKQTEGYDVTPRKTAC
ncbi:putative protein YdaS [Acidithiobacillus thiooxidans ATCC 19377]|uniref:Uncharacterized protein n=3 Tax=Acidithiobacillaceae TaxID=225058 RepID=A0A543Q6D2_ACITH|nr:putative protein YdaS [Acidithiobacillus thiooxidans ATCC 19377]